MRIIFAGTPAFALPVLSALINSEHEILGVLTQPDRPAGRGQKLQLSPIKQLALQHRLPVWQPLSLRQTAVQDQLRALAPEVIIVAAYGLILPIEILNLPRWGCINIHASLLPRWRGAAPIHRAILAGDTQTGITIMQMAAGLDTGNMLYKIPCPILIDDHTVSLQTRLAHVGAEALLTVLLDLPRFLTQAEQQDDALVTYAAKINKAEVALDWTQSATKLDRAIRGFYPLAYTQLAGQLIKVQQTNVVDNKITPRIAPGTIVSVNEFGITVACGVGHLALTQLQLAGGKSLTVAELLRGRKTWFEVGEYFSRSNPPL